jgi:hypothetical protein
MPLRILSVRWRLTQNSAAIPRRLESYLRRNRLTKPSRFGSTLVSDCCGLDRSHSLNRLSKVPPYDG